MSEFSESIYIRSAKRSTGVKWLEDNDLAGYVLEPRADWVQVFPDWGEISDDAAKAVAMQKAEELVVHYRFAADHLWSFMVSQDGESRFRYECIWEIDEHTIKGIDVEELAALLGVAKPKLDAVIYLGEGEATWEELMDNAVEFAVLLSLPNSAWASFDYAEIDAAVTGMKEYYVPRQEEGEEADNSISSSSMPNVSPLREEAPPEPAPTPKAGSDAPWQAVYDLASHFLKHLHDQELIELTLDSRLVRDRLVERLTMTVIENPVSSDSQVVHHWLDNLMNSPEIVDVFATDEMLTDAYSKAKSDLQAVV